VAFHVVVAIGLVCGLWWLVFGEGRYSRQNYEKIRDGATLSEVERLLGRPGEEVSEGQLPHSPTTRPGQAGRYVVWRSHNGYIAIALEKDGRVCGKIMFEPSL